MPVVALNGRTVPGLVCPPGASEATFWANDLPGFGLRIRASGARTWLVQLRTRTGKTQRHSLGDPETVPLGKARKRAQELIASAKLGGDPAGEREQARRAITVAELANSYLTHQRDRMKPRSFGELRRHLDKHATPLLGQPAAGLTQRAIVELLQNIAKAAPVTANRVRASLSAMFAWGMKAGLAPANPVAATFKLKDESPRERVMSDAELALIWRCTADDADHDRIVRLLLLTGARRAEIAGMGWSEVTMHSDDSATWVLPSVRSKNHLPHQMVLPALAVALLPAPRDDANGRRRELLFGEGEGPFSGWSGGKERLDKRIAEANAGTAISAWVLHDLRRTFVTRLNDLGVEPHVIEALVNHASGAAKAGIAGVYNRSAYAAQKRAALARWCDYVARLVGDPAGSASDRIVVELRRAV